MKHEHPVRLLCELLSVAPSGYYHARKQRPSARQREDTALTGRIRQAHQASRGCYGSPRIVEDLREDGHAHEQTPLRPPDAGSWPAREKEAPASTSHYE